MKCQQRGEAVDGKKEDFNQTGFMSSLISSAAIKNDRLRYLNIKTGIKINKNGRARTRIIYPLKQIINIVMIR